MSQRSEYKQGIAEGKDMSGHDAAPHRSMDPGGVVDRVPTFEDVAERLRKRFHCAESGCVICNERDLIVSKLERATELERALTEIANTVIPFFRDPRRGDLTPLANAHALRDVARQVLL